MPERVVPKRIAELKKQLQEVRRTSLEATRRGDFMRVARLTAQAAELNRAIREAEGLAFEGVF